METKESMEQKSKFSERPWRLTKHRPFQSDFLIVKVENRESVIFDGFGNRVNDAILASKSLEMFEALRKIADPWEIRKEVMDKAPRSSLDCQVIFEMAKIARSILQQIENEISSESKS